MSRLGYLESMANHFAEESDWEYYQVYRKRADQLRADLRQLEEIQHPTVIGRLPELVGNQQTFILDNNNK